MVFEELGELWRIPRYRTLLLARFVSNIGNGMAPIALAFGVLSLDGADAGSLSLVTTSQMIPLVAFLLIGGVAADRFGRSQLVGITDIIGSGVVAISAIAFITDNASVPLLCVNGFIFGVLNALWYPAFSGLMPMIVPGPLLQGANSILGFGANVGYTLGASVAGFIVATAGPGWGLLGDA
ncbi:MAG: MFS transporter, partial [Acidimicrobiia bacterium]|nr:MFS transporter [Acidimicrobiia bacterium]